MDFLSEICSSCGRNTTIKCFWSRATNPDNSWHQNCTLLLNHCWHASHCFSSPVRAVKVTMQSLAMHHKHTNTKQTKNRALHDAKNPQARDIVAFSAQIHRQPVVSWKFTYLHMCYTGYERIPLECTTENSPRIELTWLKTTWPHWRRLLLFVVPQSQQKKERKKEKKKKKSHKKWSLGMLWQWRVCFFSHSDKTGNWWWEILTLFPNVHHTISFQVTLHFTATDTFICTLATIHVHLTHCVSLWGRAWTDKRDTRQPPSHANSLKASMSHIDDTCAHICWCVFF